jgi:ankyrin repeat protein
MSGIEEEIERLLSQGSDINEKTVLEGTPLHVAARAGDLKVVRLLLARRANVRAMRSGQWGEFAGTPLHDVAATHFTEIAGILLDSGADVNSKDEAYHRTPLHRAVSARNGVMVEFLISHGANVDAVADWDRPHPSVCYVMCPDRWMTPLHVAAREGYAEIARQLVAAGAARDMKVLRPDYREFQGLTPLDLALRLGEKIEAQARSCHELQELLRRTNEPSA